MEAILDLPKTKRSKTSPVTTDVVQQIILHNISWETYEKILAEHDEVSNPHFAFCDGELEIMVLGYQHERLKDDLTELTVEIARILEIDYRGAASTTFRRQKKQKGFEGDSSFYFKNANIVRAKKEIDLNIDPPPELVIEIDITHGSLPKFPIFSALGIEEVWLFDGEDVIFYRLENEDYKQVAKSVCLPGVKSIIVTELLFAAEELKRSEWLKLVHRLIEKR
ncbi:MAG: Uma2 family endonuclease [Pyrinomonadaceae bacterium]|nr:Uma2 family endonuclease [Pyrinomonadaceae bacterium]